MTTKIQCLSCSCIFLPPDYTCDVVFRLILLVVLCCTVVSCFYCQSTATKIPGLTFHTLPADKNLHNAWLKACGYSENDYSKDRKICSLHFEDDCYRITKSRKLLKIGAVPTKFKKVAKNVYVKRSKKQKVEHNQCIPDDKNVIESTKNCSVYIQNTSQTLKDEIMDSEEYNPYDFVAIYKRLEKERNEKKKIALLNKDSKLNNSSDCNEQSSSTGQCVKIEDSSETDFSSPSKNTRSATKIKLNALELQTAKRSATMVKSDVVAPQTAKRSTTMVKSFIFESSRADYNSSVKSYILESPTQETLSVTVNSNMFVVKALPTKRPTTAVKSNVVAPQTAKRRRYQPSTDNCRVIGPVICIGDFDDGYNMPPPLSSPMPPLPPIFDDEVDALIARHKNNTYDNGVYEDDVETLNRVVNVKVFWCKKRTYKFPIRMFQSIESIYEHFAKLEDVDRSYIKLQLRNKTLSETDTPKSFKYKIVDFIDGEIEYYKSPYDQPEVPEVKEEEEEEEEEVKFCIKQKDVKRPFFISINKTDKMIILYIKISEKLGIDVNNFTLIFDGEKIKQSDNMESLELEGDECFDLYQKPA
ncbi:Hypothetical protein CINCED_3A017944 [Cinara cedri]|uniref:Ubiquitin-like domain-containing protein n=2 Tax=Cinara cedri TaxID=506608 RepID=A0A5E4NQA1_9HEMI|nr:Hypothetical protein CINCED_3A017944 [Cinara cedri]